MSFRKAKAQLFGLNARFLTNVHGPLATRLTSSRIPVANTHRCSGGVKIMKRL